MPDTLDTFWAAIAEQLQELRTAKNAADVLTDTAPRAQEGNQ